MELAVLCDKSVPPTEEIIYAHIGKNRVHWEALFEEIHEGHPDFTEQWRYYMDGKRWLLKVTRKEKTVFWLAVLDGSFRVTFYFTDKAEEAIAGSGLSADLKKEFMKGKHYGKIRGITVVVKSRRDVADARRLMELKLSVK